MKLEWILALAAGLPVGLAGLVGNQGLVRIDPSGTQPTPSLDEQELEGWKLRLSDPDLDLREQAFDQASSAARSQPALQAALQEWAGGAADPQLAWTCRLLLRELASTAAWRPLGGASLQGSPYYWQGVPSMDDLLLRMEELHGNLDQLFEDLDRQGPGVPLTPDESGTWRSEGLQLRAGPDGVECEVTTEEDGRTVTRQYRAASLEELLEAHPELRESVERSGTGGIWLRQRPSGPMRWLRLGPAPLPGAPAAPARTDILGVVVAPLAPDRAVGLGLEAGQGLLVERVEPGTLADVLGVRRGHVLVELNGLALTDSTEISSALAARPVDGDLRLVLLDRFGQERTRVWKPVAPEDSGSAPDPPPGPRF